MSASIATRFVPMARCSWGAFVLCAGAQCATAQTIIDTPVLNPENPAAGQGINVELHGNACVLYLSAPDTPVVVTRNGNAITLLVQAIVSSDGDFCIYPTMTVPFSIGAYTAGKYTVQVDAQYQEFLGGTITQTLGTLAFVVSGAVPVPALNAVGLLLSGLSLAAAASQARDRSRR